MSALVPDFYAVLGVPSDATFEAIQTAFLKLSLSKLEAHKFVLISTAYLVLKDEQSRLEYDEILRAHKTNDESQCPQYCLSQAVLFVVRGLLVIYAMGYFMGFISH